MGRFVAKIKDTFVEYGDWSWDYIKQNQPKEYYDNAVITIKLYKGDEKKDIDIPVEELVDLKLVRKNYEWVWSDKKSLYKWLFDYLKKKEKRLSVMLLQHLEDLI